MTIKPNQMKHLYTLLLLCLPLISPSQDSARIHVHGSGLSCEASTHGNCTIQPIYEDMNTFVPPIAPMTQGLLLGTNSVNIEVTYNGFSAPAQSAFQYAVDIWASLLTSDVTIEVDATWSSLGDGVLGSAGPFNVFENFTGAPESNVYYPSALADKLRGLDLEPGQPDIVANFNNTTDWYFGTDGNTPSGQFDFVSVVLHELGHGLGIVGSTTVDGNTGSYGFGNPPTEIVYDTFIENGSGSAILSFTNNSSALAGQLTGGSLFWDGPNALAANQGQRPRMYAPSPWEGGSSFSHLNEGTYVAGNPNSLMTPQIGFAEAIHSPGPILLGIMQDMGWTVDGTSSNCVPVSISASDGGCQEDDNGVLLPVIALSFQINGTCLVDDLCWGIDGAAPECVNLPANGFSIADGEGINLIESAENATYVIYFTTADGQSNSIIYQTGNCTGDIPGCTDPEAVNYDPNATVDDGSCIYDTDICDCAGTQHTSGVLAWIGDGYADSGGYDWEGQPVDFNCSTWGFDCGDIDGSPTSDPYGVCTGQLPPNNGCGGTGCLPLGLTAADGGCQVDEFGDLLPVIAISFEIDGECMVEDLCWGIDGATPECANLPDNEFFVGDGEGINLVNSAEDADYVIYFTTTDGQSNSILYTTGNCNDNETGCTDPAACNYNPSASTDDGSCDYTSCAGCTDPTASNYDPLATIDDGSCVYGTDICDCAGTVHTEGVLAWIGDGYADSGGYDWEGQPVDFNCATWGYDCGDIAEAPTDDPYGVCTGNLPPENGCGETLGLDDISAIEVTVMPNPFNGSFTIDLGELQGCRVVLVDMQGRLLIEEEMTGVRRIETSSLDRGVYQLLILGENIKAVRTVVKY